MCNKNRPVKSLEIIEAEIDYAIKEIEKSLQRIKTVSNETLEFRKNIAKGA